MFLITLFGTEIHIEPIYLLLAYAGMIIYLLARIEKARQKPDFSFKFWLSDNFLTSITSMLLIPILLVFCTDTSLKDVLPINKLTAFLAGYQTKDILTTIMKVTGVKQVA